MLRKLARSLAEGGMNLSNRLCYRHVGGEQRPVFFDVDATLPELRSVDEAFDAIDAELEGILPHTDAMPRYHEADASQEGISNADGLAWKVFFVYIHNEEKTLEGARRCPRTVKAVEGIPGILNAFFSILEPGKSVPAHEGPSYHYLRYHVAFRVPENDPPTIRVKDQFHTWQVGESVLFDDSWEHEVVNESDGMRIVLIVDVLRPLPWYLHGLNLAVRFLAEYGVDDAARQELQEKLGYQKPVSP